MTDAFVSFALIGDPQYALRDPVSGRNYRKSLELHRALIQKINAIPGLDFVVNLGDLGDGMAKDEIPSMLESCRKCVYPFRHVNGNHDLVLHSEEELKKLLGLDSFFYDFSYGKVRFIVLNGLDESRFAPRGSSRYANYEKYKLDHPYRKLREWDGMLSAASRKWLTEKLEEAKASGEIVILISHVPVWIGASGGNAVMWDHAELLKILDRYPNIKAFFAGHYHPGGISPRKGVLHKTVKALCNVSVPTATVCRVYGDRIELESIGEEKPYTHFFKLSRPVVSGRAVPGAYVMANTGEIVRTDSSGNFSMTLESPGMCCLKAVAEGYADSFLPGIVPPVSNLEFAMRKDSSRHLVHGFTDGFATLKIMDGDLPVRWFDLMGTDFGSLEKPGFWHEHSRNFWTRGEYAFTASGKVKIDIEPYHVELRKRGWFKGDFHAHIIHGENFYRAGAAMFGFTSRAEHYDWIYGAERHGNSGIPEDAYAIAANLSGKDFLYKLNAEFPKNLNGHIGNLGIEPVLFPIDPAGISNFELSREYIFKRGGVAVPVHPLYEDGFRKEPNGRVRCWMTGKEIFLWLLCNPEMCPCLDLYYHADTPHAEEFWFMLLNMGYRIGAVATSDAAFDVGRTPGSDRGATFVHMASLSEANLLQGIRERRTVVSWNGGAVLYSVDGSHSVGDTLTSGPEKHIFKVDAFYRPGKSVVVRIFRNGKIFRERKVVVPSSGTFSFSEDFSEPHDAWYLVTMRDIEHPERIVSAASPVYFRSSSFRSPEVVPFPHPLPREILEELRDAPLQKLISQKFYNELKEKLLKIH